MSFRDIAPVGMSACDKEDDDGDYTFPLVTDNNEPKPTGRKSKEVIVIVESEGENARTFLCTSLFANGQVCPRAKRMKYNHFGRPYFE